MDQGYDNPFHIICCFGKQPMSLSPSGSALKGVYWEWVWWGIRGMQQTGLARCVWSLGATCISRKSLYSKTPWLWRRVLDTKEQAGLGWAGDWWLIHFAAVLEGMRLLFFLPIMGWEDASSALSTQDDASFLKLWNTIYKKRTIFQEPLISTRIHFFFSRLT